MMIGLLPQSNTGLEKSSISKYTENIPLTRFFFFIFALNVYRYTGWFVVSEHQGLQHTITVNCASKDLLPFERAQSFYKLFIVI